MAEPVMSGRFSLYETPEGGYHIAWQADDTEETNHMEIPGFVASMAKRAASGQLNPAQMLKEMMANGADA